MATSVWTSQCETSPSTGRSKCACAAKSRATHFRRTPGIKIAHLYVITTTTAASASDPLFGGQGQWRIFFLLGGGHVCIVSFGFFICLLLCCAHLVLFAVYCWRFWSWSKAILGLGMYLCFLTAAAVVVAVVVVPPNVRILIIVFSPSLVKSPVLEKKLSFRLSSIRLKIVTFWLFRFSFILSRQETAGEV